MVKCVGVKLADVEDDSFREACLEWNANGTDASYAAYIRWAENE